MYNFKIQVTRPLINAPLFPEQRMPPLIFAVNSTHVLYTGRLVRTRPVVFNHRDRAEVQVLKSPECRADNNDRTNSKSDGHWSHLATPGHTWHLGGGGGGGEGVVFDIRLHISEDFYALAVDGELQGCPSGRGTQLDDIKLPP